MVKRIILLLALFAFVKVIAFKSIINRKSSSRILKKTADSHSPSHSHSRLWNTEDYANRPGPWDEMNLESLMQANKQWAKRMVIEKPDFFEDFKSGHAPKILWIGCSDARVPANEIIGQPPGNVFVHRNVANMVVNTDFNCMSVIQYGIDVLKIKHVIVCGHYDCGGIKASLESVDHKSPLENWLRNIRDTYRLHRVELNKIQDPMARQRRLVELNVIEQCLNIFKTAVVQKRRVETHKMIGQPGSRITFAEPRVHALVYEPTTGEAIKLPVDFITYMKDLRNVYDLYQGSSKGYGKNGTNVPPSDEDMEEDGLSTLEVPDMQDAMDEEIQKLDAKVYEQYYSTPLH